MEKPPTIPDFTLLRRIGEGSYGEVALISVALSFVSRSDLAESVREYSDDRLDLDPTPSSGDH